MRFNEDAIQSRNVFRLQPPRSPPAHRSETDKLSGDRPDDDNLVLVIERKAEPGIVGSISVRQADSRAGSFEYGIAIDRAYQRAGLGTEAARMLLRYMFGERRYHKSLISVYDFNEPSIAFHRRLGYIPEGRLREQEFFGGRYCDVILMGLTAVEFFGAHAPIALEYPA